MAANNKSPKIVYVLMAVAIALCFLAILFSSQLTDVLGGTGISFEYEKELFDTDQIITVDIQMDEEQWEDLLSNASAEEYYSCDVVINGQTIKNVGIRPKGNTSLSAIASDPDTDRYSLKLEFDKYVENQTCYGLDKLILNNNYADATNMKETVIYDMYQFLGADASLYNYAKVSVNGEYWGVYLALEAVEESFMLRNYGTQDGELYKPESMGMGGKGTNIDLEEFANFRNRDGNDTDTETETEDQAPGGEKPSMKGGGPSMSGNGADLNYTDDDLDSYSTIWDGSIFDSGDKDHRRVVKALKNVSEGNDLEQYLDVDNVLKYMAVHTFSVNMDSLSGSMAHNYYLYEYKGQLNMIPWDYNLSFGGMTMGNSGSATEMVNDPIDTPFAGTEFFDALLENEEYCAKYHEYLQMLVEEYVNGGRFDELYTNIRSKIDTLVETDPTAFYSYEEYDVAAQMLYDTVKLRAESIDGQLNGTIPSTDEGQRADSSTLVDASSIDISAMGQFSMGGNREGENKGPFQFGGGDFDPTQRGGDFDPTQFGGNFDPTQFAGGNFDTSQFEGGDVDASQFAGGNFDPSQVAGGNFDPSQVAGGDFTPPQFGGGGMMMPTSQTGEKETTLDPSGVSGMPGQSANSIKGILILVLCGIGMGVAFLFAKLYKRKWIIKKNNT